LLIRWFQFSTFSPILRVHGFVSETELWKYGPEVERILRKYDALRYRLLPYIYSQAWRVTHDGDSLMRALVVDFGQDPKVVGIWDEFMFGPAILVAPVTEAAKAGKSVRQVYLPAGTDWYDFWTSRRIKGGQTIEVSADLDTLPLYVRAGSILPLGPALQYATEKPADPIELRVYPGANGTFSLYEDENDNYNYEKGAYAVIPMTWDEGTQTLSIGKRDGEFPGMVKRRSFNRVRMTEGLGGDGFMKTGAALTYDGTELKSQE
jgi:alpha-D-xyloside xylohydrolase